MFPPASLLLPLLSNHQGALLSHHHYCPLCPEVVLGAMFKDLPPTHSSPAWLNLRPSLSFPGLWITLLSVTEPSVCIEQDVFAEGQVGLWKEGKEWKEEGVLVLMVH